MFKIEFNNTLSFFKEYSTIILSLAFILSSILGILHNSLYYNIYNIDILKLSTIEDYLFGWIKNSYIVIHMIYITLIVPFLVLLKVSLLDNHDFSKKELVLMLLSYIFMFAGFYIIEVEFNYFPMIWAFALISLAIPLISKWILNYVNRLICIISSMLICTFISGYININKDIHNNKIKSTFTIVMKSGKVYTDRIFLGKNSIYHFFIEDTDYNLLYINNSEIETLEKSIYNKKE